MHRTDDLLSTHVLPADTLVSRMRRALKRQPQDQELCVLDSVPVHGFHPANLPGEPAKHLGLSAFEQPKAAPHGHPWEGLAQRPGTCQPSARLAYHFSSRLRHFSPRM